MFKASLLALTLLSGVESLQDFKGPGYVSCPFDDFNSLDTFCREATSYDVECDFATCFTPPSLLHITDELVSFPLACNCFEARNCSDTCQFVTEVEPLVPPTISDQNFTGPGVMECPSSEVFGGYPCLSSYDFDCVFASGDACNVNIPLPDSDEIQPTVITFAPCDCFAYSQCSTSCEWTPGIPDWSASPSTQGPTEAPSTAPAPLPPAVNLTGPGFVVCPSFVRGLYNEFPCTSGFLVDNYADCLADTTSLCTDEEETEVAMDEYQAAFLECECDRAISCHPECRFVEASKDGPRFDFTPDDDFELPLNTDVEKQPGTKTFEGPGFVLCPSENLEDDSVLGYEHCQIVQRADFRCEQGSNVKCSTDILPDGFSFFDLTTKGLQYFPLSCNCNQAVNCDESCYFEENDPDTIIGAGGGSSGNLVALTAFALLVPVMSVVG